MKIGSLKALAVAGLLMALGALTPASAQRSDEMQGQQNAQNACQSDAYRLCNDAIPDRAKVASCLFRHKRELSPACRTVIGGGGKKAGKGRRSGKHAGRRHRRHH